MYDDNWNAFADDPHLFRALAELANESVSAQKMGSILRLMGYKDISQNVLFKEE